MSKISFISSVLSITNLSLIDSNEDDNKENNKYDKFPISKADDWQRLEFTPEQLLMLEQAALAALHGAPLPTPLMQGKRHPAYVVFHGQETGVFKTWCVSVLS